MIDEATQSRLQELHRRECRSFLQYVVESSPWNAPEDRSMVDKVFQLATEEATLLRTLAEWMEKQRMTTPYLGAFPTVFASYNFINIRKLIKQLIPRQEKELAQLEADVTFLPTEARPVVEQIVELNRKHLSALRAMVS